MTNEFSDSALDRLHADIDDLEFDARQRLMQTFLHMLEAIDITECNGNYQRDFFFRVERLGKPLEQITLGELLRIRDELKQYWGGQS